MKDKILEVITLQGELEHRTIIEKQAEELIKQGSFLKAIKLLSLLDDFLLDTIQTS